MDRSSWLNAYNKVNNSFKKKFVYRLGTNYGFFSEFNSLILAILYCLKNETQLILSSKSSNFAYQKGWNDYFQPFCKETKSKFHIKYNLRPLNASFPRKQPLIDLYKKITGVMLMQDIWYEFHNAELVNDVYHVQKLDINGTFLTAAKKIISEIWIFQPHIKEEIELNIQKLELPKIYYSLHIRSGDKVTEAKIYSIHSYINKLAKSVGESKLSECYIYVATDDFNNIINIKKEYPQLNIFSSCKPSANGHVQSEFNSQTAEDKFKSMIELLTEIEILSRSFHFIGTQSSNIGMYVGMRIGPEKCKYVDADKWQFWTC